MHQAIDWLRTVPLWQAALVFLAKNALVLLLAVALGEWLVRRHAHRRVAPEALPLQREEWVLATVCVVLNSVVTFAGLLLWREGLIRFRLDGGPRVLVDVLVLGGGDGPGHVPAAPHRAPAAALLLQLDLPRDGAARLRGEVQL
ncbi:MAG TPA: hypothetical protein VEU33_35215 [Archangium sp.]|nr:hypothetical protein [Archangium sp.]